jgi:iron complex outermembrane recepter protein
MTKPNTLAQSVKRALWLSVAGTAALTANAFAQDPAPKELGPVEVTGSRIKRTESETSSPTFTISKEAIEKTGALTIGDFLQEIPSIAGAATNPSVNNGGGDGSATVSLRGLGDQRTLILVNNRRIVTADVNSIPMSMVQSVVVLKDGASVVYGSDAVGGVVNFVLKKDFEGVEANVSYGVSDRGDGDRVGINATAGFSGDRGSLIFSANYNDQKEVRAADRDYSFFALSLGSSSSTGVVQGGSSRTPGGRYFINNNPALVAQYGCTNVTLTPGAAGTALGDFRCFNFGRDAFNYQAVGNLQLTPSERAGLFVTGNFNITDNVNAYVDAFTNRTRSASQIAPLPFDGLSDGVSLSQFNQYNPFGTQINDIRLRLSRLGNRRYEFATNVNQFTGGLKGAFGDTSWTWDANINYGTIDQDFKNFGYIDYTALSAALGPSRGGVCYTDGTFTTVIPGCIPVNFVGAFDPDSAAGQAQLAALGNISIDLSNRREVSQKGFQANFAGDLFAMSAGNVQAAFGLEYRKLELDVDITQAQILDPTTLTCGVAQEICSSDTRGSYDVKEVYGEARVPFTENFSMDIGTRFSDYSSFGSTVNSKVGFEFRPSEQLLLRATYAQVFRAPQIADLFGGLAVTNPTYADPCNGITQTGGGLSTNPACVNVVADGTFAQSDTQATAILGGNANLKPEEGDVITLGLVYEPSWLEGFSTTVDVWNTVLDDAIGTLGTQNILNACAASTAASPSPVCRLITRRADGSIQAISDINENVGKYDTAGVDLGFKYRFDTAIGQFRTSLDATYLQRFDVELAYLGAFVQDQENAGTFLSSANGGLGNYSKWRALGNVSWSKGIWDASWNLRYIDGFTVGSTELDGTCANLGLPRGSAGCQFSRPSYTYHNLQVGVKFLDDKFKLRLGVDNLTDKTPPILYQNNSLNGNTDERTFDTVGRYYWMNLGVTF